MAGGYLGKISAIVTVNTGDFSQKLNAAAADVQKFGRSMEGNLRAASNSASRAFEGIYTPLQKLERGLQAASTMKLSFKGFEGALRDVDGLKSRLASLARQQIRVDVTGTGFSKVEELRAALKGITSKDVGFVRNLGGLTAARGLSGAMTADEQQILAKFDKLKSLRQIQVAVEVVGQANLDATSLKMRQAAAAAVEIARPLDEAARLAQTFGLTMQQNVSPAMVQAQAASEALRASFGKPLGSEFSVAARQARELLAVMKQLGETRAAVGSMKTGKELVFSNPMLAAQLARAGQLGEKAAAMSPAQMAAQPGLQSLVQQVNAASTRAVQELARVQGSRGDIREQITQRQRDAASAGRAAPTSAEARASIMREADQGFAKAQAVLERLLTRMARAVGDAPKVAATSDVFGPMLGSSTQKASALVAQVKTLQGSIEALPTPLQTKLIPALERAREAAFALGKNPTAAELAKAAREAGNLERQLSRAQQTARFSGTFRGFINNTAADRYESQLNAIRQGLLSVGATASGPVARAINAYSRALREASDAGRLGTAETKQQMESLLQTIARVAVEQKNLTEPQAKAFVQTVQRSGKGDISRMGLGNFNLAMQQAAFAVDDFMSSTGGVEFKLRAISNNITQMAFILGGTQGLWIGLGAVMTATLGIPLARAIFDFDRFENQNKSLNDQLEKSKGIAERTAEAYKELGKSLRESAGTQGKAAAFAEERRQDAIDLARANVLQRSPRFAEAQSRVTSLEERMGRETDIGRRGQLLRELDEAKRKRDAISRGDISPPSLSQVNRDLDAARAAEIALRRGSRSNWEATDAASSRRAREAARERPANVKSPEEAIKSLDRQIKSLGDAVSSANFFERARADFLPEMSSEGSGTTKVRRAREMIANLEEERARLEQDAALRRNERFMPRAMQAAAARELTPEVIERMGGLGLDSSATSKLTDDIDAVSKEFAKIITDLEAATREGLDTTALETGADRAAAALELLYKQADNLARDVALGAIVPTKERLARAGGMLEGIGPSAIATDIARTEAMRVRFEEERKRAETRGDTAGVSVADYNLEALRSLTTALEAAAVSVASFQRVMEDAAGALSATLVQEARSRAQDVRRAANRFGAGNAAFAGATGAAEAEAEAQAQRDRELRRQMNAERLKFEASLAPGGTASPEMKALAEQVRRGRATAGDMSLPAAVQEVGRIVAEDAQARLDEMFRQRPEVRQLRGQADAADTAAAAGQEQINRDNDIRRRQMGGLENAFNSNVRRGAELDSGSLGIALSDADAFESLKRKIEEGISAGLDVQPLQDEMVRLRDSIETNGRVLLQSEIERQQNLASMTEGRLDAARQNLSGVGISDLQGRITAMEVRRSDLERRRDEALQESTPEGRKRAEKLQAEIDAQNDLAAEILASSVALKGFQDAVNKAAMDLQNTLVGEAQGRADQARRQANEAEAIFGDGSPEAKRARERQDREEASMRDAEGERRRAEAAIADDRARFEQEMQNGANPAAQARAERIAELDEAVKSETLGSGLRAKAKAERDRLMAEQEQEFENRPGVKAERKKADEADREMQQRQSVERGLEMGRTEEEKRREEVRRQTGDLANAVNSLKDAGQRPQARQLAQRGAAELARQVAPMFAQFGDEVLSARLQGPSRAALQASDIQTTQGASELNRLIRGEDSARDNVNLVELKKQSTLLEAIEKAVKDNTGIVVNI